MAKKLLVADDSLTIQKVIKLALSNDGYEIQTVSDGNDAIQQISLFRPDIVLVDVSLPERSAFELKKEANDTPDLRSVRFVLMSSAYEKVDEEAYSRLGFSGKLTKPFDPGHLRKLLQETLKQIEAQRSEKTASIAIDELVAPPAAPTPDPLWSEAEQPAVPKARSPEEDIRELTASTLKMSGFEDMQWSVDERAKLPTFSESQPETAMSAAPIAPPEFSKIDYPKMVDLDTGFEPPLSIENDFAVTAEPAASEPLTAYSDQDFTDAGIAPPPSFIPSPTEPVVAAISTGQMESMIRDQLRDTLERMAKEMLPELAERILKQEIHRMLDEKP